MHLTQKLVLTCCVALGGQRGATRSSRKARQERLARHVLSGVGWTSPPYFFPDVVPELDANPEHKRLLNLYTKALLLLRRPPYRNKHGATRTTSATCRACCVVT